MKRTGLKRKDTIAGLPAKQYWDQVKRRSFEKNKGKQKSRKPLPRSRKRIAPRSEKRIVEDQIYAVLRADYLKDHPTCECGRPECEKKEATDIHHTYAGKNRSSYYLEVDTWIAVSRICHTWIHENSKKAKLIGLLK